MSYKYHRHYSKFLNRTNGIIVIILLAVLLGAILYLDKVQEDNKSKELKDIDNNLRQERKEAQLALEKKEAEDSIYQKLVDGFEVNVLIVGDSIAERGQLENGWCTLLKKYLRL